MPVRLRLNASARKDGHNPFPVEKVLARYVLLLLSFCSSSELYAAQLQLINGDLLEGEIQQVTATTLHWKSPVFGALKVAKEKVALIDGERLPAATCTPVEIALAAQKSSLTGRVDLGFEKDEGSSDSEEYDIDIVSSLKTARYVHTFEAEHEIEIKGSSTTEEDYMLQYQADRYFSKLENGWFSYGRMEWNKNRFRSPEVLRAVGVGSGYAFRPSNNSSIDFQLGVERVWGEQPDGRKIKANGGRLGLGIEYELAEFLHMVLFHDSEIIWLLEGQGYTLRTSSGARVHITRRLSAEVSVDYDVLDVEDSNEFDDVDSEWKFKLGYSW